MIGIGRIKYSFGRIFFSLFLISYLWIDNCYTSFPRGNERRPLSYLTNPELAESSCFDGTEYAKKIRDARDQCNITVCTRAETLTEERCQRSTEWMRSCGIVRRLFKGCDSLSTQKLAQSKLVKDRQASECLTTSGNKCRNPWIYNGRIYRGCSTVDYGNIFWCHDESGPDAGSSFGTCSPGCPEDVEGVALADFCHTTSGQPCKFPFTYLGKEYVGCTDATTGTYWCEDNLGRTLTQSVCEDVGSVCKTHDQAEEDGDFEEIPQDKYCFLRHMKWIDKTKTFRPDRINVTLDDVEDQIVKDCLNYALTECKKSANQEFSVEGPLSDIVNVEYLACTENRFTRFCNRRLESLVQSMANS